MDKTSLPQHKASLRLMPCMVCGCHDVQLHHAGGGSMRFRGIHKSAAKKVSDWLQIPLCERHHTGEDGVHRGVESWECQFGGQAAMLDRISIGLNVDVWAMAKIPSKRSKYQRPLKINPRRASI